MTERRIARPKTDELVVDASVRRPSKRPPEVVVDGYKPLTEFERDDPWFHMKLIAFMCSQCQAHSPICHIGHDEDRWAIARHFAEKEGWYFSDQCFSFILCRACVVKVAMYGSDFGNDS